MFSGPLLTLLVVAIGLFATSACGSGTAATPPTPSVTGLAATGQQVALQYHCADCHSVDGAKRLGPTWKGLAGSTVRLSDGTTVTADAAYLRESIEQPTAKVVQGFPPVMPKLDLTPEQVDALVAYIQALG